MNSTAPSEIAHFTERREDERVAIALDVALAGDSQFFAGITGDIARGGLFVQTYRSLPIDTVVELKFTLPDGAVVETLGTVRWVRTTSSGAAPGLGIAFQSLEPEARARIEAFCKERAPLYYDDAE